MAKRIGPVLAVIGADVKGFTDGLSKAQRQLQQFSATASVAGARASAAFAASFGAISAFALKTGADFELAFANIRKTVDGSEDDFKRLESGIRNTAQEFGIAATEIADLARIGGQLGLSADQLDDFTKTIAKLSIAAAELDPETAARGLARLAALTGEGAPAIEKMANVLAKLGDTLPTTEDRILDFSGRLASFGSAVGLSSEEILGLSAGFSALVGGTERAATSVERFLGEMASSAAAGGAEFEKFAELAMMSLDSPIESVEQFAETFEKRPIEAIELVIGGMNKLGEQGLAPLLNEFDALGIKGVRMLSTFAAGAKGADVLSDALRVAAQEAAEQTKLNKELAIQMDTVSRQFDRLKAALVEVGIRLFQAFKEQIDFIIASGFKFVGVLQDIAAFIGGLGPATKFAIVGFIGMLGAASALLLVLGTLGGLVTGLAGMFTTLTTALGGVSGAAATAGTQLSLFGSGAGGAVSQLGLLSKLVGPLSSAFGSLASGIASAAPPIAAVIAGILGGTAAMQGASAAAAELEGGFSDTAEAAVAQAGLFATAWEGSKLVVVTALEAIGAAGNELGRIFRDLASQAIEKISVLASAIGEKLSQAFNLAQGIADTALRAIFGDEAIDNFVSKLEDAGSKIADFFTQFAPDALVLAFDELGDQATAAAERLLHTLGKFPPAIQPVTDAQRRMAEQLKVTITATDTAQTVGEKLINAQREQAKAFAESAEGQKQAREEIERLAQSNMEVIDSLLANAAASDELKKIAKELGLNEKELNAIIDEQGPTFLKSAEAIILDKKAREEWNKIVDAQKRSLDALTIDAASTKLKALQQALEESKLAAQDFTQDGLDQITMELIKLADTTGEELTPRAQELISAWVDNKLAAFDVDKAFQQLLKTMEKMMTPLDKLSKADLSGMDPFGTAGAPVDVPGFGDEDQPGGLKDAQIKEAKERTKEAKEETKEWNAALAAVNDMMQVLGITSDSAFGQIIGGLTSAARAGAQFKTSVAKMGEAVAASGGNIGKFLAEGGLSAGLEAGSAIVSGISSVIQATAGGGVKGAIGGALAGGKLGSDIGSMFGPVGAQIGGAIGAGIGAIVGAFRGKPEFVKIMDEIGRDWGVEISEELAKEIEATAERLDLGRFESRLLHLGDVIGEAGGVGAFGLENTTTAVNDLMNAIANGSVPAGEGIEELGTVFGQMAEEMFEAGTVADAALLQVIARSRELGLEVPEIAKFIADQLAQAAAGVTAIIGQAFEGEGGEIQFGGIQVATPEDAQAQATIFATAFFATLEEQGLVAAIDAFGPAFDEMKAKFEQFGDDIDFGGIERFFNLAKDPNFRPLLEGIQGLSDAMAGLANAGFLTEDAFSAFQQQGQSAFDQLMEAGLSQEEALQQLAPFLQQALEASQRFGFELDENTKKLIEQAEAAGIGFETDPMNQMVDVLALIAEQLGVTQEALAGVGVGAQDAASQTSQAFDELEDEVGGFFDTFGAKGEETWDSMKQDAIEAAQAQADAAREASEETQAATDETAEASKDIWTDTQAAIDSIFEESTGNVIEDYQAVIDQIGLASEAVSGLGETAITSAFGFDQMADAARQAAEAAKDAAGAGGPGGGGGPPQGGQFGLTTTVNEPTMFIAGEAGEETVTIDPGGSPGGGGSPAVVVLQLDGKTIGKVIGDLSRTGDVRIHPSAVKDFG